MQLNKAIALLTIRLVLGFIFVMQGIGKVFTWGMDRVYENAFEPYTDHFHVSILYAAAYYTSYVELIAGLLLLLGLWRDFALYALASVLVIVSFGHGLQNPIWGVEHVLFRLILISALLILPKEWDIYRVDYFLKR